MEDQILRLFKTCPDVIKKTFQEVYFQSGDLILSQGAPPEYAYILIEGQAGVYQLTLNGIVYMAYMYGDGELFGEIEALIEQPVVSNVRANRLCKAIRIPKSSFLKWIEADRNFALLIAQQLAEKLYNASIHSVTNIAYPLKYRVLYYLWNAYQHDQPYVKKEDIIAGVGSNERSINRIIKELADSNCLESDRGMVKVTSLKSLLEELRKYE